MNSHKKNLLFKVKPFLSDVLFCAQYFRGTKSSFLKQIDTFGVLIKTTQSI